ncbi:MAG: DNA polymerase III subunit chi [Alphaproteobacteria bacterium]
MAIDITLYIFQTGGREAGLVVMLDRHLARYKKAIVLTDNLVTAKKIDDMLWEYNHDGFLPHDILPLSDGGACDDDTPHQPIVIVPLDQIDVFDKNYNSATAVFCFLDNFDKIADVLKSANHKIAEWYFLFLRDDKQHESIMAKILALTSSDNKNFMLQNQWHQTLKGEWSDKPLA